MNIRRCRLQMTSGGCPEAYDVFFKGKYIGHLRLRHGCFTACIDEECVYTGYPVGDGIFDFNERDNFLKQGVTALKKANKAR